MIIKISFIIFCFLNTLSIRSQPSIVVFATDKDFMLPYIEETLKSIKHLENNSFVFKSVINLNRIARNISTEIALRKTINHYTDAPYILSDTISEEFKKISEVLSNNDYLLTIDINSIDQFLEYQLHLYESIKDGKEVDGSEKILSVTNPLTPIQSVDFIVDLGDENLKEKIANYVKMLFPESNYLPVANISKVNNKSFLPDTAFVSTIDTLFLHGFNSYDLDSGNDNLHYEWRLINERDILSRNNDLSLVFARNFGRLTCSFPNQGVYLIGLKVFDGISYSKEDTLTVFSYALPTFFHSKNKIRINSEKCLNGDTLNFRNNTIELYVRQPNGFIPKIWIDKSNRNINLDKEIEKYYSKRKKLSEQMPDLDSYLKEKLNKIILHKSILDPEGFSINFPFDEQNLKNEDVFISLEKDSVMTKPVLIKVQNNIIPATKMNAGLYLVSEKYSYNNIDTIYNSSFLVANLGFYLRLSKKIVFSPSLGYKINRRLNERSPTSYFFNFNFRLDYEILNTGSRFFGFVGPMISFPTGSILVPTEPKLVDGKITDLEIYSFLNLQIGANFGLNYELVEGKFGSKMCFTAFNDSFRFSGKNSIFYKVNSYAELSFYITY